MAGNTVLIGVANEGEKSIEVEKMEYPCTFAFG
jgi:hypothetical protein